MTKKYLKTPFDYLNNLASGEFHNKFSHMELSDAAKLIKKEYALKEGSWKASNYSIEDYKKAIIYFFLKEIA